jgi:hypothetical protein
MFCRLLCKLPRRGVGACSFAPTGVRPPEGWVGNPVRKPTSGQDSHVWKLLERGQESRTNDQGKTEYKVRCLLPHCPSPFFWLPSRTTSRCFVHLDKEHDMSKALLTSIVQDADELKPCNIVMEASVVLGDLHEVVLLGTLVSWVICNTLENNTHLHLK